MKLTKRHLTGKEYLATATDLLQRARFEFEDSIRKLEYRRDPSQPS